jgi:hypothetical protein
MGHLFNKSVQILASADGVDIVASYKVALTEAFLALENSASKIGLRVNQDKIKYVLVALRKERENAPALWPLNVGEYKFERVEPFIYLGTKVII